jgi:hypothetical protein
MDQGLSIRTTVHLRLQVQMQMKSTGVLSTLTEKQLSSIFPGGNPVTPG